MLDQEPPIKASSADLHVVYYGEVVKIVETGE